MCNVSRRLETHVCYIMRFICTFPPAMILSNFACFQKRPKNLLIFDINLPIFCVNLPIFNITNQIKNRLIL